MNAQTAEGPTTRQRVLESACKLFAEKGFRDATVQDICHLAEANIAAVNYYFRDKESLYVEALRHASQIADQAYPLDGGLPADAPAQERLRAHVGANVRRLLSDGPERYFPLILVKEMAEPTAAREVLFQEIMPPIRENMRRILDDLLGEDADPARRRMCVLSTISQFLFLGFNRLAREHMFRAHPGGTPPSIEELIDHMTRFALAGIRAAREAGETKGGE